MSEFVNSSPDAMGRDTLASAEVGAGALMSERLRSLPAEAHRNDLPAAPAPTDPRLTERDAASTDADVRFYTALGLMLEESVRGIAKEWRPRCR